MDDFLDRKLQKAILSVLKKSFNEEVAGSQIVTQLTTESNFKKKYSLPDINKSLQYLAQHGLVNYSSASTVGNRNNFRAKITAKGLDFLDDDGGLSAILNVVTVKLHGDTIRELMIAKVEASNDDPTVKKNLIKKLKELPADAMEKLSMGLLEIGISKVPDLIKWLSTSNIL